ncbi:tor family protein [Megaselia abdita]
MLIKLITYSLLTICINFKDKGGNPPCSSPSMSDMIRENNNRLMFIARCCVQCLENNTVEEQQRKCLDYCKRNTSEKLVFKNIMSTESLKLLCRDDRRLVFSLQSRDSHPNGTIYIVKIMKYFMNSTDLVEIYMSNTSTFQLPSLYPGTKYNISIASLNLDLEYAIIANNEVFSTIRQNLKPKKIEKQNIHVISYQQDPTNMSHLSATITWKPSDDMCYYYELLWYSTSDTMALPKVFEVHDIREVYSHTLNSLELGTSYAIGIRTKMVSHTIRESNISWIEPIITPQCLSWHHNNTDVCAPYPPRDLHVREIEVDDVSTSLNVSWTVKLPEPHYYILELLSLSRYHSPPLRFNLTGNFSFYVIEIQKSNTTLYQIRLTAVNPGGSITVVSPQLHLETKIILHGKSVFIKMAIILLVAFSLIAITAVVLYRKPPIEQMKKYCGHEGLIMTDPIKDQKNFIEFTSYFDDLEISLDNIKIEEEELGAGAFGIVKRCIFKDKDCNFKHAAVKMLKLNPSVDEIKAFHREISMMKAVGKHQNIVSIIGHCTKTCDHLYLLTEYCAKGSLLDFLRQQKIPRNAVTEDVISTTMAILRRFIASTAPVVSQRIRLSRNSLSGIS